MDGYVSLDKSKSTGRRAKSRSKSLGLASLAATLTLVSASVVTSVPSSAALTVDSITKVTAISGSLGPAVGSTVWASAFERELPRELLTEASLNFLDADYHPEEYVYRITTSPNDSSTSVDPQSENENLPDYTSLTAQKQEEWYQQFGFSNENPYEFRWVAFLCFDGEGAEIKETTNVEVNYASLEDGLVSGSLDSTINTYFNDAVVSIEGNGHPSNTSVVGNSSDYDYDFVGTWNSDNDFAALGVSAVDATCPIFSAIEGLEILDPENPVVAGVPNPINAKSLDITEEFHVWNPSDQVVETVPALGVTIGVTGVAPSPFNAALWGVATIQETTLMVQSQNDSSENETPATENETPETPQPPQSYSGPIITEFSDRLLSSTGAQEVTIDGVRLNLIKALSIAGNDIAFARNDLGEIVLSIPALPAGEYDLEATTSDGSKLIHQDAFMVRESATVEQSGAGEDLVANASRSLRYVNFAGDSSSLPRNARLGITRTLASLDNVTRVVCRGWTSGTAITPADAALALQRAQQACNIASRMHPSAEIEIKTSPSAGLGAEFRSVSMFIAFRRD